MWIHAVSESEKLLYDHELKTSSCMLDVLKRQITVVVNVLVWHQISAWLHRLENLLLYINKMFLSSYAMQQCIYCTHRSIPLAEINVIYALIVHGLVVYRNICRKYEALLVSWHSTVIKDAINERKTRLGTHIPLVLNQSHQHHCTITKQYKL